VISVVSNLEPAKTAAMIEAALAHDVPRANALHYQLFSLMGAMFCYPSPAPAKKGLELMGKITSGEVRLPMTQMDESSLKQLTTAMSAIGLL
jgi:4-hydroxy-tetrahydrodipicolinate synthase